MVVSRFYWWSSSVKVSTVSELGVSWEASITWSFWTEPYVFLLVSWGGLTSSLLPIPAMFRVVWSTGGRYASCNAMNTSELGSHSHEIGLSFRHLLRVKTGPTNQGRQSHTWLWHVSWLQWPFHKTISEFVILLGPLQLCQLIFAATSVNIDWALPGNGKWFTFHVTQWQPQATQGTWINSFNPLI